MIQQIYIYIYIFNNIHIYIKYICTYIFSIYIQRKLNHYIKEISILPYSLQHHSQQPRHKNYLNVHGYRWIDEEAVIYMHDEILFSHYIIKIENPAIFDNMDGPESHYAEQNKSNLERQTLHDLTYMWNPKTWDSETE